jgi:purine-binding chemotaxis protein CheW
MENTKAQIDVEKEDRFSVFEISGVQFGLNVLYIKEVIKPTHITRLPNAPPYMPGIINLRGKIISVVDLALFWGINQTEHNTPEGLIVTESESSRFAVFHDRMHEFLKIKKSDLADSSEKILDSILPFLYGIFKDEVILLDGAKLLSSLNFVKL